MASGKLLRFQDLPTELVIQIITSIDFSAETWTALAATHPRIYAILLQYERSITKVITATQLPNALADFPPDSAQDFMWLKRTVHRYDVIDSIMGLIMIDNEESGNTYFPVMSYNISLVSTGFLVLYHMQELERYEDKAAFIKSCGADPLVAMILAVHFSTLAARLRGAGLISKFTYSPIVDYHAYQVQNEIELCFSEGCFNFGPDFVEQTLHRIPFAEQTLLCLYHEKQLSEMTDDERPGSPDIIGPANNPELILPRTLRSYVYECLANFMGCSIREVLPRILDMLEDENHRLVWLGREDRGRLVRGLDV